MAGAKEKYELLLSEFSKAKEVVWRLNEDSKVLIEERMEYIMCCREKIFSLCSNFSSICAECGGKCCEEDVICGKELSTRFFLVKDSIFILTVAFPDFILPVPEFDFLEKHPRACLMLGEKGCLLGAKRPTKCLSYFCSSRKFPKNIYSKLMNKRNMIIDLENYLYFYSVKAA